LISEGKEVAMRKSRFIFAILIILVPYLSSAEDGEKYTGYTLYNHLIKYDSGDTIDYAKGTHALGFFRGAIDGLVHMNSNIKIMLSNLDQTKKDSDAMTVVKYLGLNIPSGTSYGQLVLVYKKWAENNPEILNEEAVSCIYYAIRKTYPPK
jgi:hypothetical protein